MQISNEPTFRLSAGIIFLMLTVIRIYYTAVAFRSGSSFSIRRLGSTGAFLGWFLYTFILFLALVYIFAPSQLEWAELPLPPALRWFGVALGTGTTMLLLWVHHTLGQNFAASGIIQARQVLITRGPYRWVRHPMYTTFFMISLSFALITANGLITILCLLFAILLPSIIKNEEQTLLEKFGVDYREYMQRTGRFLPRMKAK